MSEPSELQETMTYLVNKALDEWGESDPRYTAAKMIAAGLAELEARLEKLEVERASSLDRDFLGRLVRQAWVEWAKEQPNPKSSWLEPWDDLSEDMKEADRRIGEHVASCCVTPELLIVEARLEEVKRERDGEPSSTAKRIEMALHEAGFLRASGVGVQQTIMDNGLADLEARLEAAERERCAKQLERALEFYGPESETYRVIRAQAAAIRAGEDPT